MKDTIILKDANVFYHIHNKFEGPKDILITKGQIQGIGKFDEITTDKSNITEYDCKNKFIIPGLIEGHSHVSYLLLKEEEEKKKYLKEHLENGITSIRDVGGPILMLEKLDQAISSKKYLGPKIYYSGPMLEKSPLRWEKKNEILPGHTVAIDSRQDVDKVIEELITHKASLVKTFGKHEEEVYKYLVEKATENNLPVTYDPGPPLFHHIPINKAIELGVTSIEHGKSPWPAVLKDQLQLEHDNAIYEPPGSSNKKSISKKLFEQKADSVDFDKLEKLIKQMIDKNVFFCPTLDALKAAIGEEKDEEIIKIMKIISEMDHLFTKEMIKSKVKIIVGYDSAYPNCFYNEIELLNKAGLSNAEVIKGATIYTSQMLNLENVIGSIEEGKRADLVVLNADPIQKMDNIKKINMVIKEGEVVFNN